MIALTSVALPLARAGETYRYQLFAYGGSPGYIFSLADGSLPHGVELASNGSFSGVPKAAVIALHGADHRQHRHSRHADVPLRRAEGSRHRRSDGSRRADEM
jgi:hypothetical protein